MILSEKVGPMILSSKVNTWQTGAYFLCHNMLRPPYGLPDITPFPRSTDDVEKEANALLAVKQI